MNESSSQPPSFQTPSDGEVLPEENMDEFKADLQRNERARYIVASYLSIWPYQFNLWSLKNFRTAYPGEFDPLVGRIQNLIDRHDYTNDTIRNELLEWLAVVGVPSSITEVIIPTASESQSTVVPAEEEVAGMREELERLTVPVEKESVDVHARTVSSSRPQELLKQITTPYPPEDHDPKGAAFSKKSEIEGGVMPKSPWGASPAEEPVRGQQKTMQVAFGKEGVVAPFVSQGNDKPITRSQWQSEIGPQLQEEVAPFFDKLTPEDKRLLAAVLNTQDTSDPEEVVRMIMNHAPESNANAFRLMNKHVTRFIERLCRPAEEVRKALAIKLDGGRVLPEPAPKKQGINPREQKTILSTRARRGILDRFLGNKK